MPGWLEVVIRSVSVIIILFAFSKGFIRKPIGECSSFEFGLVAGMTIIGAIGAFNLQIPIAFVLTALVVWGLFTIGLSILVEKSASFRTFMYGRGVPLIKDGKILEDNMTKQHVTSDELLRRLRSKDVFQTADVEFAVLESNGELNVLLKSDKQPLNPSALQMKVASTKEPETVIKDGEIMDEPLATRGLNRTWLETELAKIDASVENVFLAQVDKDGQLTVDLFDDQLTVPEPVELALLAAGLKKVQADFSLYALDTDNKRSKERYEWCEKEITELMNLLKPYTS
ncbi:DUF421 domain-containing protein [Alkalihalophilus lindianensis]|uniref:DUF421 domain-containing protein n=1 Tax=Alkalihalophilus lindianensis TaxID=1630542 RepID=A0ABU3X682_9BACI|nr:DUF421 domain-containing protein [Alkalihalophilus lindianensis]MDV2683382.1 DUF421 domain-containing protein [Alkalihalophilus lindianensis]